MYHVGIIRQKHKQAIKSQAVATLKNSLGFSQLFAALLSSRGK